VKTFYLDRTWVGVTSLAVALSFAAAGNLMAQSTTTDGTSPAGTDNPFSAATAGLPDAGGTAPKQPVLTKGTDKASPNPYLNAGIGASLDTAANTKGAGGTTPKQPIVLSKETGSASPTIWQRGVTGASLDTASKSGGTTSGGGTGPKQPVVLNKELGGASPTIWQKAVTGESFDTTSKSGGITKTTGAEINAFKMGVQSPVDTQSTKPTGKRHGQPVVVP
jgi:hypothetical protein